VLLVEFLLIFLFGSQALSRRPKAHRRPLSMITKARACSPLASAVSFLGLDEEPAFVISGEPVDGRMILRAGKEFPYPRRGEFRLRTMNLPC